MDEALVRHIVSSMVYVVIGLVFFGLAAWMISRLAPFSVWKEIEEDQNIALAILIGSTIIGIALIISAAIHG